MGFEGRVFAWRNPQVDLWKTSGHFDFYRDSMFNQMDVDTEEYQVRGRAASAAYSAARCCGEETKHFLCPSDSCHDAFAYPRSSSP